MPRTQFGLTAFQRARGNLPELPVINMFAEEAPTEETGVVLQSRPGLQAVFEMGAGPVQTLFFGDNTVAFTVFGVSDGGLYSGSDFIGLVDGPGPFSIDGFKDKIFVAGGGSLWGSDGATLTAIPFPDGANVRKVLIGASRAICIRDDTDQFYWSDVLSDNIGALSFATAETQPDRLLDALFIDDILILFGAETVEFWPSTQDPLLPFQPLEGRVFERGIKATGCAIKIGSTFAWVTDANQVCMSDPENIISNQGLEALVEASASVSLWTYTLEGTEFLALRIDAGTWVYSMRSQLWSQCGSYGQENWIPQCFARGRFGSSIDGRVMSWTTDHSDLGGILERRFRAGFPLNAGGMTVNNTILRTNPGQTPFLTGDYADPGIEMRRSLDGGQTWGKWRRVSLGAQGKYRKKVQWPACGMAGHPGWLSEFRVTDPVPFRVSDVLINEPFGGI